MTLQEELNSVKAQQARIEQRYLRKVGAPANRRQWLRITPAHRRTYKALQRRSEEFEAELASLDQQQ